jgi:hypothetical protein
MKMHTLIRLAVASILGVAAAVLVSCGSSGTGLIPAAAAGPLQSDFEAVAHAAAAGNGSCAATESALGKTEQDFLALPASVDRGLHARLEQGIANLRKRALAMCIQPTTGTSTVETQTSTTPPPTASTETSTTPPATSTPTTETPTTVPQDQGGGTEAPGEQAEETPGKGKGKDKGKGTDEEGEGAGTGAGGASAGGAQ